MDLIEIDAASNTSVEDVRDLRDKINFAPSQGRYKVYIIDEVHMLSIAAFNALLKTLEEPPPHAIFILATTEIHKIPATVLSRCQRHEFRRFPLGEITRRLSEICRAEGIEAEPEALTLIARQSSGGMRDAISLLDQLASTGGKITLATAQTVLGTAASQSVIALTQALIERNPAAGLDEIHRALDGGADARALARQVVEYLRGLLLIRARQRRPGRCHCRPARPDDEPRPRPAHHRSAARHARLQRRSHRPARRMVALAGAGTGLCRNAGTPQSGDGGRLRAAPGPAPGAGHAAERTGHGAARRARGVIRTPGACRLARSRSQRSGNRPPPASRNRTRTSPPCSTLADRWKSAKAFCWWALPAIFCRANSTVLKTWN